MIVWPMILKYQRILDEIHHCLSNSNFASSDSFIESILNSQTIIVYGAGRVGLAMRGFAKRLRHLGLNSFYLEDSTVPSTGVGDLLIIGSGSGSTQSVLTIAEIAKANQLQIISITCNPNSPIAALSSSIIVLNAPSKTSEKIPYQSIQPMTTLFEQTLMITLDSLVLEIMDLIGEDSITMQKRHNVIE